MLKRIKDYAGWALVVAAFAVAWNALAIVGEVDRRLAESGRAAARAAAIAEAERPRVPPVAAALGDKLKAYREWLASAARKAAKKKEAETPPPQATPGRNVVRPRLEMKPSEL